jgi:hypothetical protein
MTDHKLKEDRGGIGILTVTRRTTVTTIKMNEQNIWKECLKTGSWSSNININRRCHVFYPHNPNIPKSERVMWLIYIMWWWQSYIICLFDAVKMDVVESFENSIRKETYCCGRAVNKLQRYLMGTVTENLSYVCNHSVKPHKQTIKRTDPNPAVRSRSTRQENQR